VELSGPGRVGRRCATGVSGGLDLALRAPTDRVLSAPAEWSFAHRTRRSVRSILSKWPRLSVRQDETETRYAEIRPRRRLPAQAGKSLGFCHLLACQRIYEGAGVLGLQSTSLPLCRIHTPPCFASARSTFRVRPFDSIADA